MRSTVWMSFGALLLAATIAGTAQAECVDGLARDSAAFIAFDQYVRDVYNPPFGNSQQDKFAFGMAYGHAFGRMQAAIEGDARRDEHVECAYYGLQNLIADSFGLEPGRYVWDVAIEASKGRLDVQVADYLGVNDASPLSVVFQRLDPSGGPGGGGGDNGGGGGLGPGEMPTLADLRQLIAPDLASMSALGDFDHVCYPDTPAAGEDIGTHFGTLGPWTTSTCADQTCEDEGGPVAGTRINICGRGLLQIHSGGTVYVGHFNGVDFAGYWYGSPSCWHATGPQRYQCEQPLFGDKCWGEIAFQGFEQVPELLRDTGRSAGQVGIGYSNRCGLSGENKREGMRWAYYDGPYFFWALQDGRK